MIVVLQISNMRKRASLRVWMQKLFGDSFLKPCLVSQAVMVWLCLARRVSKTMMAWLYPMGDEEIAFSRTMVWSDRSEVSSKAPFKDVSTPSVFKVSKDTRAVIGTTSDEKKVTKIELFLTFSFVFLRICIMFTYCTIKIAGKCANFCLKIGMNPAINNSGNCAMHFPKLA